MRLSRPSGFRPRNTHARESLPPKIGGRRYRLGALFPKLALRLSSPQDGWRGAPHRRVFQSPTFVTIRNDAALLIGLKRSLVRRVVSGNSLRKLHSESAKADFLTPAADFQSVRLSTHTT